MPNLRLPSTADEIWNDPIGKYGRAALTLDSDSVAIVPADDQRIAEFAATFPVTATLMSSFKGPMGESTPPSALIVRRDAPVPRRMDAIAAFRNAVALSFALRARAAIVSHKGWGASAAWSDKFDFHAAEVDKNGNIQVHSSALAHSMGQPKALSFAPSPILDRDLDIRFVDDPIAELLGRAWHDHFLRKRKISLLRPVFRSLEIAYQAAVIPWRNVGSLYDFGLSVAHWVSALETLLWPVNRRSNQVHSLQYCGDLGHEESELRHRRFRYTWPKAAGRKSRVGGITLPQKVCALAYEARNAFLHGDEFRSAHLAPRSKWPALSIVHAVSLLYRFALRKRLLQLYPSKVIGDDEIPPFVVQHWFTEAAYEKAMLAGFEA